jgi:competence protein ComEA
MVYGIVLALALWAVTDLNSAAESEIATLPGIGPSKARAIVDYRTEHGGIKTLEELDDVPGIGPATIANLRGLVTVDAPAASVAAPADRTTPAPISSATGAAEHVNINTAGVAQLATLPGIGATQAQAIVEHRDAHGPFASCDALIQVPGIGPATLAGLVDHCTVK